MSQKTLIIFCAVFLLNVTTKAELKKPNPPNFDIQHYKIDISLNEKDLTYTAKTEIRLQSLVEGLKKVDLHYQEGVKTITLPLPLKMGEEVTVTVPSEGKADEREQDGLFVVRPNPKGLPQFFTQFETRGARKVFPCFDEPFDKATTEVLITASKRYTILSNGNKVSEKILPDGKKQVHFVNKDPISTYHITLIAAELSPLRGTYTSVAGKSIPLAIYTRPGFESQVTYAMDVLKKSFHFFENYFGVPYPWDSYGIVALPGFLWGGMENKGLANLNEARLLWNNTHRVTKKIWVVELVAHELAHEWFGNKVTMHWWDDLWLNEAFASFAAEKLTENLFGPDRSAISNYQWLTRSYFPQDRGPLSHPIIPKQVDTIHELFDSITYSKGFQVVRMLEEFVGEENFRQGIQNYFSKYHLKNATTTDFLKEIEETSHQNLKTFAGAWLHQKGYPQLSLEWVSKGLQIRQEGTPFVFKLSVGNQTLLIDKKNQIFDFPKESWGKVLPVNRGGKALLTYTWKGIPWPVALNDEDPFVRFETLHQVLQEKQFSEELKKVIHDRLWDPNKSVGSGVSWALVSNQLDPHFLATIAKNLWSSAKERTATLKKNDPQETEFEKYLLTFLGQADFRELDSFLKSKINSPVVDETLGAMEGLLRSNAPDRYTLFEKTLKTKPHLKLDLLMGLAATPKVEVLAKINQYLSDPNLVAKDDSTLPVRVWRTVHMENKEIVFSEEGVAEVNRFVRANLDRPGIAGQALKTLEEIAKAPKEIKKEVAQTLTDLLKENPPAYVASLGKKILAAAEK